VSPRITTDWADGCAFNHASTWRRSVLRRVGEECGLGVHRAVGAFCATYWQLGPTQFLRIHRDTVVNLARVREAHPMFKGGAEVVLPGHGTRLDPSRRFRAEARAVLGLRWAAEDLQRAWQTMRPCQAGARELSARRTGTARRLVAHALDPAELVHMRTEQK
jgi:hypothetical protein